MQLSMPERMLLAEREQAALQKDHLSPDLSTAGKASIRLWSIRCCRCGAYMDLLSGSERTVCSDCLRELRDMDREKGIKRWYKEPQ